MAKSKKRRASNRPTYQPSPKITSALSKAESLIEDRRYEEAKALLVPLAESHPRSRPVLLALIEICQEQQDWAGFVRYSEQLLPLERGMERASTLNNLVFAHTQLVYPALAWQAAQELVNEYPDHPQVEKFKRLMQTTETFLREHSADLPTVANLPPDEQMELLLLHDRVRLYTASGQAEKAIAAAESLLAKAPDFIPGLNNLSLAYFTVGRVDQAIATAQRVLALVPDNFHALGNLTRYHFLTARFETAGDYAARLQRLIDGPSDLETKQAEALAFLGDDRGVRAVYERARKRTAELEPVLLHLAAAAHYRLGDEKTAWRLWREAVKREPTLSLAQENLADQRRPVGERDAPWYWSMHYWLPPDFGQSLKQLTAEPLRSKSEEAAQRAFNALLDRYPYLPQLFPHILERGDRAAREMVIGLIRLMGRPELARILVDFALGRYGADDVRMDAIQFVNQEYPEWLPEDRRVMMWIKGKPTELFLLGWEVNGEPEVPMNVPEDVWDKHTRATELLQEGQLETAKTMLREVIAAVPDFPAAYNHLTLAYQMEGRDEEARAMVKDLYARFPDYLFARVAMAQLLTQEKRVEEARTILDPLLRRRRFHFSEFRAVAQAQMAIALAEGSQEGARHWLDMWAEVEPDHPGILQWRLRIEGPDRMLKSLKELTGRFGRQKGDRRGLP